jgi:hypothetical protein
MANMAPMITISVLALGIWLWRVNPGMDSIVAASFLPAVWLGLFLMNRTAPPDSWLARKYRTLRSAMTLGGLLLVLALVLRLAEYYQYIAETTGTRISSIGLGLFLMVIGNALPKTLQPLREGKPVGRLNQQFRRFLGWVMVLTGAAYALCWVVLPFALAEDITDLIIGLYVGAVIGRFACSIFKGRSKTDLQGS